eukprot:6627389-Prymnesium_polylepis.1
MEWFMRGCAAMEAWGTMAVLFYFEEYLRRYRGRGLPVLYDGEIANLSQGKGKGGGTQKPLLMANIDEPKSQESQMKDDSSKALAEQMAEMLKAQAQVAASVSSMAGQVSKLQSEVAAVKAAQASNPGGGAGTGQPFIPFMQRTCHHCGEKGHVIADCPLKQKPKKENDD